MVSRIFIYVEAEREVGGAGLGEGRSREQPEPLCFCTGGCCSSSAPLVNHLIPLISPLALNTFTAFVRLFFFPSADAACSDLLMKAVQPELNSNSIMRE